VASDWRVKNSEARGIKGVDKRRTTSNWASGRNVVVLIGRRRPEAIKSKNKKYSHVAEKKKKQQLSNV
jgi:hypothetical protein